MQNKSDELRCLSRRLRITKGIRVPAKKKKPIIPRNSTIVEQLTIKSYRTLGGSSLAHMVWHLMYYWIEHPVFKLKLFFA